MNTTLRLAVAFALLSGATLLSWWLGLNDGQHTYQLNAAITCSVVLVAALKVRIIAWEFMELRHAPLRLRWIADGALASITLLLLALYFAGRWLRP